MEPFNYRGKKFEAWSQSGTVLSTSKHSRTTISGHGGGGFVGPNGTTVSAPTLVSSTTTEQEIWIRRANGEETAIQLSGVDIPVREGQHVTFIAAKRLGAKDGFWVTLVNHSANRHWRLSSNAEISMRGRLGAYPLLGLLDFAVAAALCFLMIAVPFFIWSTKTTAAPTPEDIAPFGSPGLFFLPLCYIPLKVMLRTKRKDRIFAALDKWAERNAQEAYDTDKAEPRPAASTEKVA